MTRKSSTETLVAAMRILARDIQSGDGVANAAIAEAADRLAELQSHVMSEHLRDAAKMVEQQARIADLEAQAAIGRRAVDDLAMLVRRLVRSLKKADANNDLCKAATDYLRRAGSNPSPLRQMIAEPATVAVDAGALEALRAEVDRVDLLNDRARRGESTYSAQGALLNVARAARKLLAGGGDGY